jgi:hypothetical protein
VQQKILENVSPVFARMCNDANGFTEGDTGRLFFKDDDEDVCSAFLYWLVKHEIDFVLLFKASATSIAIKSACFADKYCINEFFDEAMSCLINTDFHITVETLKEAFDSTTADCPLRELLVDKATHALQAKTIKLEKLLTLDGTGFLPLFLKLDHVLFPGEKKVGATRMAEQRANILKRSFRGSRRAIAKTI